LASSPVNALAEDFQNPFALARRGRGLSAAADIKQAQDEPAGTTITAPAIT